MNTISKEPTFDEIWDNLLMHGIATEDELRLVCHINGSNIDSLNSVLHVRTSYRDWNQYKFFLIEDEDTNWEQVF